MTRALSVRLAIAAVVGATALAAACTMKDQKPPSLTGPSEFGTSITLSALPDAILQDGASQSLITATARDASGQPLRNAVLRAEIRVGGLSTDFGALSAKSIVTGSDGKATFVYTAPPSVSSLESVDTNTIVDILVTPSGTNFDNSVARSVAIRLLPVGVVLPPNNRPVADFTFSPATATENVKILFDASTSTDPDGHIVSYDWTFSDGDSGSGIRISRAFATTGSFSVTLKVTDDRGATATVTKTVTIGPAAMTAAFTFSPTDPLPGQSVSFNASTSKVESGRRIVSYVWDFGDGSPVVTATGSIVTHTYRTENSFTVTLTITDDLGRTATVSGSVPVKIPTSELRRR